MNSKILKRNKDYAKFLIKEKYYLWSEVNSLEDIVEKLLIFDSVRSCFSRDEIKSIIKSMTWEDYRFFFSTCCFPRSKV